jgi:hypothetical protein
VIGGNKKEQLQFPLVWILLIVFLVWATGVIGDDYSIPYFENSSHMTIAPVNYVVREGFYQFVESRDYLIIDIVKFFVLQASIFGCYKFFNLFHKKNFSMLLAFAFVFFPIHDGVTYWYTAQGYLLCCALYFYAYVQLSYKNYLSAFLLGLLASFMGYGSPPFAVGMAYLAYRKFGFRASLLMLLPNIFYVIYYLIFTKIFNLGIDRVSNGFDLLSFSKNIVMQMGTAVDALVGPSALFKIYYSIADISFISIFVLLLFWIFVLRRINYTDVASEAINKDVVGAFFLIMVVSWILFASTGLYPQTSFNLGDRVTLWGGLLIVYFGLNFAVKNKFSYILYITVLFLSVAGISDHWKNWHISQKEIIENVKKNEQINLLEKNEIVFVSGNGYSKLGPFSHLEFFSVESYASSIFRHALGRSFKLRVIYTGDNLSIDENHIVRRGDEILIKNQDFINFYDSSANVFEKKSIVEFKYVLHNRLIDQRHWIQVYGCGELVKIIDLIAPRYKYLCAKKIIF